MTRRSAASSASSVPENVAMKGICQKLGFRLAYRSDDPVIQAEIDL